MADYQRTKLIKHADDVLRTFTADGLARVTLIDYRSPTVEPLYHVEETFAYTGILEIPDTITRQVTLI